MHTRGQTLRARILPGERLGSAKTTSGPVQAVVGGETGSSGFSGTKVRVRLAVNQLVAYSLHNSSIQLSTARYFDARSEFSQQLIGESRSNPFEAVAQSVL